MPKVPAFLLYLFPALAAAATAYFNLGGLPLNLRLLIVGISCAATVFILASRLRRCIAAKPRAGFEPRSTTPAYKKVIAVVVIGAASFATLLILEITAKYHSIFVERTVSDAADVAVIHAPKIPVTLLEIDLPRQTATDCIPLDLNPRNPLQGEHAGLGSATPTFRISSFVAPQRLQLSCPSPTLAEVRIRREPATTTLLDASDIDDATPLFLLLGGALWVIAAIVACRR